jgi:hypothetical protein
MKKFFDLSCGVLGGIGFVWAGVWILVWDAGKLHQAHDSRDWPRAEGTVTQSRIDDRQREHKPHVEYTYTVAGVPYTSRQISFDLFDKPGGQGRIETIVARYPVGQNVTVYRDPQDPEIAILEPEDYSPFLMPLVFGILFISGGSWILWKTVGLVMVGEPRPLQDTTVKRRIALTAIISVMIYLIIILVSCESAVRETFVKAFGERRAGLPNSVFMLDLQTLLYIPMPWVFWHASRLAMQALEDGRRPGVGYLLTVGRSHPHLRHSQNVCVGGLVYFVVVCAAWIIFAAARGI